VRGQDDGVGPYDRSPTPEAAEAPGAAAAPGEPHAPDPATTASDRTRPLGRRRLRSAGGHLHRATRGGARLTARSGRYAAAKYHAYTHSGGAGESGLARLTELQASHSAGDAAMMLALAGTLFFDPQTAQARGQVAIFLLLTMVPFTLVAPLVGPLLDRFGHGRRWAIGSTLAVRAFLCWVLGEAINNDSAWLYPAALGCLVASKAYTITRSAAVPRLLPAGTTLVRANSKASMAGVIGAVVGGAMGGAALLAGPSWALRVAFVVFVVGTIQAIRLPARVDSAAGELDPEQTVAIPVQPTALPTDTPTDPPTDTPTAEPASTDAAGLVGRLRRRVRAIPWPVMHALWSTGATRLLTGFVLLFMAFLAKERPIGDLHAGVVLAVLAVAIGVGNASGSVLGNTLKDFHPHLVALTAALATVAASVAAAVSYGLVTVIVVGLVQGVSAQLSKLCFDSLVQREVPERVRTSVFAWSETVLQVLWVVGGTLGIVLPLDPRIGFGACAVGLLGCVVMALRQRRLAGPRTAPHRATGRMGR
jgi:MFS family permease